MTEVNKIKIFDLIVNCDNKFKAEVILALLRSRHNLNDSDLFELIDLIYSINDEYKLSSLSKITSIDSILKHDKSLDIFKIIDDCNDRKNIDNILRLLENKTIVNNDYVIELIKIINKNMPDDISFMVFDTANKLACLKNKNIVEYTDIVSKAVNPNAACMANIIVTNEELYSYPYLKDIAIIMSQCEDDNKSRDMYKTIMNLNQYSEL